MGAKRQPLPIASRHDANLFRCFFVVDRANTFDFCVVPTSNASQANFQAASHLMFKRSLFLFSQYCHIVVTNT